MPVGLTVEYPAGQSLDENGVCNSMVTGVLRVVSHLTSAYRSLWTLCALSSKADAMSCWRPQSGR